MAKFLFHMIFSLAILVLFGQIALAESAGPWCDQTCCKAAWKTMQENTCYCDEQPPAEQSDCDKQTNQDFWDNLNACYSEHSVDCFTHNWQGWDFEGWDDCNDTPGLSCFDCPDDDGGCPPF